MGRRLAFLMFWSVICADFAAAADRIALVIGNAQYQQTGWALRNPGNDARLMTDALEDIGFSVTTVLDADEDAMEAAFKAHGERLKAAGSDAVGFFFFAGHGVQSRGINHLLPTDTMAYEEADVWGAPRLGDLFAHLQRAGNDTNFVVIDACRNNGLLRSYRSAPSGLANMKAARGMYIAFSAEPGTVASDGDGPNTPFAMMLSRLLKEPGLPAETMFRRVRTRVNMMSNGKQLPWSESGLLGDDDFCFAGCGQGPSEGVYPPVSTAIAANSAARSVDAVQQQSSAVDRLLSELAKIDFSAPQFSTQSAFESLRPTHSLETFHAAAAAGDSTASLLLGRAYSGGLGVPQDYPRSKEFYVAACDAGNAVGCTNLGFFYNHGLGVDQDYDRARQLYKTGCDGGVFLSCGNLGYLYEKGYGVAQDFGRARQLYQQACDGGHAAGCTNLGFLYDEGLGGARDYNRARQLYKTGCDGGNAVGCTNLGYLYDDGLGGAQDYGRARQLYQRGCDGGSVNGCTNLGFLYSKGLGGAQDEDRARQLYQKACDGGSDVGCDNLTAAP